MEIEQWEVDKAAKTKRHYEGLRALAQELNPVKLGYDQFPIDSAIVIFESTKSRDVCLFAH